MDADLVNARSLQLHLPGRDGHDSLAKLLPVLLLEGVLCVDFVFKVREFAEPIDQQFPIFQSNVKVLVVELLASKHEADRLRRENAALRFHRRVGKPAAARTYRSFGMS